MLTRQSLAGNGPLVWAVSVGGAVRRCVMRYFSRETVPAASHHGAIFASPGERYSCPGCRICPEPEKNWQMSEKLIVMIKLSRWRAKIVTSLLPIPALLAFVLILKLSRCNEFVTIFEICQGFQSRQYKQDLSRECFSMEELSMI